MSNDSLWMAYYHGNAQRLPTLQPPLAHPFGSTIRVHPLTLPRQEDQSSESGSETAPRKSQTAAVTSILLLTRACPMLRVDRRTDHMWRGAAASINRCSNGYIAPSCESWSPVMCVGNAPFRHTPRTSAPSFRMLMYLEPVTALQLVTTTVMFIQHPLGGTGSSSTLILMALFWKCGSSSASTLASRRFLPMVLSKAASKRNNSAVPLQSRRVLCVSHAVRVRVTPSPLPQRESGPSMGPHRRTCSCAFSAPLPSPPPPSPGHSTDEDWGERCMRT